MRVMLLPVTEFLYLYACMITSIKVKHILREGKFVSLASKYVTM